MNDESVAKMTWFEDEPRPIANKTFLLYRFPERKKDIARLSYDQKMEWYSTRDPKEMVILGNDPEFQSFWKWRVVVPVKLKRLFYRLKNFEVFRHYDHISEIKKARRKGPERI